MSNADASGGRHTGRDLSAVPQAEFAVSAGAGRRVHADQPDAFTDLVTRFLDSGIA